jgi:putative oligomerization/nucleic acid binding protein
MRAAMVGGAGYAAGKRRARTEQHEYDQDAQLAEAQQPQAPAAAPPPAPAAPAPAAMSEAEKLEALKNAKELLDSGVLTQAEFDAQKQKLLNG